MASKFQRNVFESGFDSFEFDDGFFVGTDSNLKKKKLNEKQSDVPINYKSKETAKSGCSVKKNGETPFDIKAQYYDLPLFLEDLNESDFFESSTDKKNKHNLKVPISVKIEREKKSLCNGFTSCLSPIEGSELSDSMKVSSSTPLKSDDDSNFKKKVEESSAMPPDIDFLEADLFDDWGVNEMKEERNAEVQRETVTFSQALRLIEEAKSAMEAEKEPLNESVDLLTGELVGPDVGNLFEGSFHVPKPDEKLHEESSIDCVVIVEDTKTRKKPPAAQILNFESEKKNDDNSLFFKENNVKNIYFNSDDDFDFFTQDLLKKPKNVLKSTKTEASTPDNSKTENSTPLKSCDLNDSTGTVIKLKKKRGRNVNVIESDTTEDSPSPKFRRQSILKTKKRHSQENVGREFIDSEAEVSDEAEVSSDEVEEEGEYDKSFLDEESYFTQNCSADMIAKYLESVKSAKRFGAFKIPTAKPYDPNFVFSQIPEVNTDYEIDSFCVNEVEEEVKTDLSDLEVAEMILEMGRKKRKKKRNQKVKNIHNIKMKI